MPYKIFQLIILCAFILNCSEEKKEISDSSQDFNHEIKVDDEYYFEKDIYQVVDNVYVAIGYGLANSILIVGDGGKGCTFR